MRYIKSDLGHLTPHQRDQLDCHYLFKTRYLHTGEKESIIEVANHSKYSAFRVPPKYKTEKHIKYFISDYRSDQTWQQFALYHFIGEVEFYSATTYCTIYDKRSLRLAGNNSRPVVYYYYLNRQRKIEPVSKYLISDTATRVRADNHDKYQWRREQPEERRFRDPLFEYSDQGESDTELESESEEEEKAELRNPVHDIASDIDSVNSYPVGFLSNNPVVSQQSSRAPSVVAVQQLLADQEENSQSSLSTRWWDIADAYTLGPL